MNSTSWIMVACPCVINLWLWWDFMVFPTTVTDPSHSLRMTFNVSLIMKPYRISSFRAEVRMLYEKTGRRLCDTEQRIYYSDDTLRFSPPRWQILHIRSGWRLTFSSLWRLNVLYKDHGVGRQKELLAHAVRLRILACRNDLNRKRIVSLQLTAHSW